MKLAVGPIPLYHQLEQDLTARITSGEYAPGTCLPTEEQIGQQYGVSRITVRKALESLLTQGLITRRRGVGSFVAEQRSGVHAIHLSGSLDEFLLFAHQLMPRVVSLGLVDAPEEVAEDFGLSDGEQVVRLELVSHTQEGPTAHSEFFFRREVNELLKADEIVGGEPIVRIVERKLGTRIARAMQVIEADVADEKTASLLGLASGTPVLRARRTYFDDNDDVIEIAQLRYHPGRYRYEVELRPRPHAI
jgi:GntR family transcriptional regulator